jgi:hypothetical protein
MERIDHHPFIVEFQDYVSEEECNDLIFHFENASDNWQEFCFYGSYGMNPSKPSELDLDTAINMNYIEALRTRIRITTGDVFKNQLYNTAASAHKWIPGSFAEPHADNTNPDGTPSSWRQYKYVSLLYLNDDYEGGELYFINQGIEIKPRRGSLIMFDPSAEYLHGVRKIKSGNRYTLMTSWDIEGSQYSEEFMKQKERDIEAANQFSAERREMIRKQIERGEKVGE